jgi:predicted DNA-binding transcriptional regulator AlpA
LSEELGDLLTLAQAAKMLGMDRSAAYRAFPPENRMKVGTVWFVSRSEVEAYAAEQRRGWPIGRPREDKRGRPRAGKEEQS